MTALALPSAGIASPADQLGVKAWPARVERAANLFGSLALLPGVLLGAVMFIVQSV